MSSKVSYMGRMIPKEGFRVFIYGADGVKKLVESYSQYEIHMQSGVWFSSLEEVENLKKSKVEEKKSKSAKKKEDIVVPDVADDFLSKIEGE